MAKIPIEIFNFTQAFKKEVEECVDLANRTQDSIEFILFEKLVPAHFDILNNNEINTRELFDEMEKIRMEIGGFHPYWIMINDSALYNNFYNIFGSSRAKAGLGVFTTNSIVDSIIPKDKMKAYFIYYFGRYALSFLNPSHKNHRETRDCIYDRKVTKSDIIKSMKKDAFCEECKTKLLSGDSKITIAILNSVNKLLGVSESLLNDIAVPVVSTKRKKVFISYSHVDEKWKDILKVHLKPIEILSDVEVWSDEKIKPGEDWFERVQSEIAESIVGILLISPHFLASDFINKVEIPSLLKNVENEGGLIFPVIIRHSLFTRIKKLSKFQATNRPSRPIAGLTESEQDEIFVKIAEDIWDVLEERESDEH
ncbi:MAG: toll/interleukin-1 receptor domain-containing protein [Bacteroidota bacterium]